MMANIASVAPIILVSEVYTLCGNDVLMLKRPDKAKRFSGYLIGPGGHIEHTEDPLTAAIREVEEETSVVINEASISLKAIAIHHHTDRNELWYCHLFRAEVKEKTNLSDKHKEGTPMWVDKDSLHSQAKVFPPSQYYFEHILNNHPGIMYTNLEWENMVLTKTLSRRIDSDG